MKPLRLLAAAAALTTGCAQTPTQSPMQERTSAVKPAAGELPAPEPVKAVPLQTPAPLHTVVLPSDTQPIVSIRLVFRAGSVDDPKGKEGLTALTTDVLSEGGTQELSAAQLLEALYPMAAELEASTDKEFTVLAGRVHRDKLDRFLKIFTDLLLAPRLDPKEFDRLRTDALNRIRNDLRGESDEMLGQVALDSVLYDGHPYRHFVGGTVAGLQAITLEDVRAHWKRVFTQDRLVVGLAGPVDEALQTRVLAELKKLPAEGAPRAPLPPAPGIKQRTLILEKDALSTAISLGYTYPLRRGHPDYYRVAFALSYFGEHRQQHGVLFNELREKRGLNYGTYAYPEHFHQEGWGTLPQVNVGRTLQDFTIWIRPVEPQNAVFATKGALYYFDQLIQDPIPQDRFETSRGFLMGYTRQWEQTDQRRLGYAIDDVFYGTKGFLDGYREALRTMTPQEVRTAIRRHLSPQKLNFAFVAKDAQGLARALGDTQTPALIEYPTPKAKEVLEVDQAIGTQPIPMHPALLQVQSAQTFMEN